MGDESFRDRRTGGAFRAFKRFVLWSAIIGAVALIFAVAVGGALTASTSQKLEEKLAEIRATGAPTSKKELLEQAQALKKEAPSQSTGCPATKLLFELKQEAFVQVPDVRGIDVFGKNGASDPERLVSEWDSEIAAAVGHTLENNRATLDTIHEIAGLPLDNRGEVIEHIGEGRYLIREYRFPDMLAERTSVRLLVLEGILAVKEQRPDDAFDAASRIIAFSEHVENASPGAIGIAIGQALRAMALTDIVRPGLNETEYSDDAASRFFDQLMKNDWDKKLSEAIEWERLAMLNAPYAPSRLEYIRVYLLPFWHNADLSKSIDWHDELLRMVALPYPEFVKKKAEFKEEQKQTSHIFYPMSTCWIPPTPEMKTYVVSLQALEDLARVAFALRAYKQTHGGYPDTLDVLVPDFIDAVPSDRFTERPFLYRKDGDGCTVYSAGPDMHDDGGIPKPKGWSGDNPTPYDVPWTLAR